MVFVWVLFSDHLAEVWTRVVCVECCTGPFFWDLPPQSSALDTTRDNIKIKSAAHARTRYWVLKVGQCAYYAQVLFCSVLLFTFSWYSLDILVATVCNSVIILFMLKYLFSEFIFSIFSMNSFPLVLPHLFLILKFNKCSFFKLRLVTFVIISVIFMM